MIAVSPDRKLPIGADSGEHKSGYKNMAPTKNRVKIVCFDDVGHGIPRIPRIPWIPWIPRIP
jgi:hypothetical protein